MVVACSPSNFLPRESVWIVRVLCASSASTRYLVRCRCVGPFRGRRLHLRNSWRTPDTRAYWLYFETTRKAACIRISLSVRLIEAMTVGKMLCRRSVMQQCCLNTNLHDIDEGRGRKCREDIRAPSLWDAVAVVTTHLEKIHPNECHHMLRKGQAAAHVSILSPIS